MIVKRLLSPVMGCVLSINAMAANFFPLTVADLINDINTANGNTQDDIIDLGGNTFTLTAIDNGDNGLPLILADGGNALLVQNGVIERSSAPMTPGFRIFEVANGANLSLNTLTLKNGAPAGSGGAVLINSGGILSLVDSSSFEDNGPGPILGGAIHFEGTTGTIIRNSTFSNNEAAYGGAINMSDADDAVITNSTFSGNTSQFAGGALFLDDGSLQISNTTITGNTSSGGAGGGIHIAGNLALTLDSTIIALNSDPIGGFPDISNNGFGSVTEAFNLIGDNSGSGITAGNPNGNNSIVGTSMAPIDPLLGPLNNNGGPTRTHALLVSSPALDAGSNPLTLSYDQRGPGFVRTYGAQTDIGAFEQSCIADSDDDGICDDVDNCPEDANADQADADGDGLGDVCDPCPDDRFNDADDDGVCGDVDNCPFKANPGQEDADEDDMGDACDTDNCVDDDEDNVCDYEDNCLDLANEDQADADGDGIGDACDECPDDRFNDADNDGICGDEDNCPFTANPDQTDTDEDDIGNACDWCPADAGDDNDEDEDGICDAADRCVGFNDADDEDNDGIPDDCDNCPLDSNYDQLDIDQDGVGDDCDDDLVLIPPPPPPPPPPVPWPPGAGPVGAGAGPGPVDAVGIADRAPKEIPAVEKAPNSAAPVKKKPKEPQYTIQEVEVPNNDVAEEDFQSSGCSLIESKGQNVMNMWLLMVLIIGFLRVTRSRSA